MHNIRADDRHGAPLQRVLNFVGDLLEIFSTRYRATAPYSPAARRLWPLWLQALYAKRRDIAGFRGPPARVALETGLAGCARKIRTQESVRRRTNPKSVLPHRPAASGHCLDL
jgi:hypothetical protein